MQFKLCPLETIKLAFALTVVSTISAPLIVTASDDEKTRDMAQLTCAEFMDMGRMEKVMSVVWYSGWMAEKQGDLTFTPDRGAMSERQESLETACENSQNDLVLNQLQVSY